MLNKIREINKRHNDTAFRMALDHLFRVGSDALSKVSEEEIDNICKNIIATEPKNSLMTGEMRADILRCAYELSKISLWDILKYVQIDMKIDGAIVHPGMIVRLLNEYSGSELTTIVVSADVLDEAIDEVFEAFGNKASDCRKRYGNLHYFEADKEIRAAFKAVGISVQSIEPDRVLYV